MATVTLSSKFQISIPKQVRETLNLRPGQASGWLFFAWANRSSWCPSLKSKLLGIGKGANPAGYRDRDTRREDRFPKSKPASTSLATVVKSKPPA